MESLEHHKVNWASSIYEFSWSKIENSSIERRIQAFRAFLVSPDSSIFYDASKEEELSFFYNDPCRQIVKSASALSRNEVQVRDDSGRNESFGRLKHQLPTTDYKQEQLRNERAAPSRKKNGTMGGMHVEHCPRHEHRAHRFTQRVASQRCNVRFPG